MTAKAIIVLTTADSEELAEVLAGRLVESRVAACVNLVPGVRSIYRWEGKVCDEKEFLLVIKTTADRFESVRSVIRGHHTYQVPEVVALPIVAVDPDYYDWLKGQTGILESPEEGVK